MKDFLIVGMGFSGIALACELEKRNLSFSVADPATFKSSTAISGGLVNPVTGRKYNLQWNIKELTSKLIENYRSLEESLSVPLLFKHEILKIHKSESALEEWQSKKTNDELKEYVDEQFIPGTLSKFLDFRHGCIKIKHAFHIDTSALVSNFAAHLIKSDQLIRQFTDPAKIEIKNQHFEFNKQQYRHVVFCEGINAMQNPFFKFVHFKPAKGECLLIEIPNFETSLIIHKGIILIPIEKNKFWAGATNTWDDLTNEPTPAGKTELEVQLKELLKVPFEILRHDAAVRPTIRDRVPVIGEHPEIKGMFILNGMGTKGASLSWYYAEKLIEHILQQNEIPKEVNVSRFFNSI